MRRSLIIQALSICSLTVIGTDLASASPIDFTILTPAYNNTTGYFPGQQAPGFIYSATPDQLIITGPANLPDNGLAAYANLPNPVTGDFSATVQTTVTNTGGIGYYSSSSTAFAGMGYGLFGGNDYVYSNYGLLSQGNVSSPSVSFPAQTVTEKLSRSGDVFTASIESDGQWTQALKLSSTDLLGPAYLSLTAYGTPGENFPFTATYTNLDVTAYAPTTVSGSPVAHRQAQRRCRRPRLVPSQAKQAGSSAAVHCF